MTSLALPRASLQLNTEREQIAKQHQEQSKMRKTMQGFVSQEKQKFERLASQMKARERDLAVKSEKLRQVTELIRNSPCATRTPLRESTQENTPTETPKVRVGLCVHCICMYSGTPLFWTPWVKSHTSNFLFDGETNKKQVSPLNNCGINFRLQRV